jgi:ribosomal protein L29
MLKVSELRSKTLNELNNLLQEYLNKLEEYVSDVYRGKEKDISKTNFIRKDISRIKTIINEKKFIEEEKNAKKAN